jgi:hypothetical protein
MQSCLRDGPSPEAAHSSSRSWRSVLSSMTQTDDCRESRIMVETPRNSPGANSCAAWTIWPTDNGRPQRIGACTRSVSREEFDEPIKPIHKHDATAAEKARRTPHVHEPYAKVTRENG